MKRIINLLILPLLLIIMIAGCGKKKSPKPDPGKSTLVSPAQNEACTSGVVVSATESTVTFNWAASDNTESYELSLKNLLTSTSTVHTASSNQLALTLLRNTPYSWYVVSKSTQTPAVTQSDVWKFYNAGLGAVSHSPFPAEATAPAFGHTVTATAGTIKLTWNGSDVDNDIAGYDVYFGTTSTPAVVKSNLTDKFWDVTVTSGTTYYWSITTKDSQGNSSNSDLFQFKVN